MGRDKAMTEIASKPLIAHAAQQLIDEVAEVVIVGHAEAASLLELRSVCDYPRPGLGPLGGVLGALRASATRLVLVTPCDLLGLPPNVALRLQERLGKHDAAVPRIGDRVEPFPMLLPTALKDRLESALSNDERRVQTWLETLRLAEVDFADQPGQFANLNTPERLHAYFAPN